MNLRTIERNSSNRFAPALGLALLALLLLAPDGRGASTRQVAAGALHSVAVKTDGTLWAWGSNWNGQLGDGTTYNKSSPVQAGADTNWQVVAHPRSAEYLRGA